MENGECKLPTLVDARIVRAFGKERRVPQFRWVCAKELDPPYVSGLQGDLRNHERAFASVLKKFSKRSATFLRPESLGWVPSSRRSSRFQTMPSLLRGTTPSPQRYGPHKAIGE